jgi:hypothetical protein
VIDELAARLADVDGTVARLARQLLARCRDLTVEINAWRPSCGRWCGGWRQHCWPCPAAGCWARR